MKRTILITAIFLFLTNLTFAQETPKADPKDVESMDAILAALYDVISGPAGEKRDWDRMRSLFIPEARLIPTGKSQDGKVGYTVWSVEDYVTTAGPNLERGGFFEQEIHREVHTYGTVSQVFSTYAARRKKDDAEPFMRGINSIQLLDDGQRWWVVTIFWMTETPNDPVPKQYDTKK